MFKLKAEDTFTWPVKAKVPDNGKFTVVKFDATFKILSQSDITTMMGDPDDADSGSLRVLDSALLSFSGMDVEGDDGEPLTDDDERKEILFRYPFFVKAVSDAFASGIAGHRIKN